MSDEIRRNVGVTVAKLQHDLDQLPKCELITKASPEHLIASYSSYLEIAQLKLTEISRAVEYLDHYNEKWIDLIIQLRGPARDEEEMQYEKMAADESGLLKVLDRGREAPVRLQYEIDQAEKSIRRIREEEQNVTIQCKQPHSKLTSQTKLPTLSLPIFSGNITQWPIFWSLFDRSVHSTDLNDADKLAYLLGSLRGAALDQVSGFTITAENYPIVLKILKDKFGDNARIKYSLRTQLRELPQVRREADLLPTLHTIENILQLLESIGGSIEGDFMQDFIEAKLPFWLIEKVYKEKAKNSDWSVRQLRELLRATADRREQVYFVINKHQHERERKSRIIQESPKYRKPKNTNEDAHSSHATLITSQDKRSVKPKTIKPKTPCVFCGKMHFNDACKNYESYEERRNRANELQLCRKCLRKGHPTGKCYTRIKPYYHCKSIEHPSALCPVNRTKTTNAPPKAVSLKTKQQSEGTTTSLANEEDKHDVIMSTTTNRTQPVLICKVVDVSNSDESQRKETITGTTVETSFDEAVMTRKIRVITDYGSIRV